MMGPSSSGRIAPSRFQQMFFLCETNDLGPTPTSIDQLAFDSSLPRSPARAMKTALLIAAALLVASADAGPCSASDVSIVQVSGG
jgi:hypothetical protein